MNIEELKQDIASALEHTTWVKDEGPPSDEYTAYTYRGTGPGKWAFLVVTWVKEEHKGADGTAHSGGMIIHLPPELAKMAAERAEEWLRANK